MVSFWMATERITLAPSNVDSWTDVMGGGNFDNNTATFELWFDPKSLADLSAANANQVLWETGGGTGGSFTLSGGTLSLRTIEGGDVGQVLVDLTNFNGRDLVSHGELEFEWDGPADYRMRRDGDRILVDFDRAIGEGAAGAFRAVGRYIEQGRIIGDGSTFLMIVDPAIVLTDRRSGNAVVFELRNFAEEPQAAQPAAPQGPPPLRVRLWRRSPSSDPASRRIPSFRSRVRGCPFRATSSRSRW